MNILILGSGGREHAFAWKIAQSEMCQNLYVAPGNAGTLDIAKNINISPLDFEGLGVFCLDKDINLVLVGPEDPLVKGIRDHFKSQAALKHIIVIGPDANAARLEGSKDFCKEFLNEFSIPTARYQTFEGSGLNEGKDFLRKLSPPYVLKADGLAAGKGVLILNDLSEAETELENMLSGKFGDASKRVVIEEFLDGIEFSVFVLTDGSTYKILPVAKDYKRIGEGDSGLNTGGMGAVSPVPFADDEMMQKVEDRIIKPTIEGIKSRGMDYVGFIFLGLINVKGDPYVIEYNVRMGDPETEVVLPRVKSDLLALLTAAGRGELHSVKMEEDSRSTVTVMTVSEGYPESYEKGKSISGLSEVKESIVFHAGTAKNGDVIVTNGGRVMAFTSYGNNMKEALQKSYDSIKEVCFDGITFRRDIGYDL